MKASFIALPHDILYLILSSAARTSSKALLSLSVCSRRLRTAYKAHEEVLLRNAVRNELISPDFYDKALELAQRELNATPGSSCYRTRYLASIGQLNRDPSPVDLLQRALSDSIQIHHLARLLVCIHRITKSLNRSRTTDEYDPHEFPFSYYFIDKEDITSQSEYEETIYNQGLRHEDDSLYLEFPQYMLNICIDNVAETTEGFQDVVFSQFEWRSDKYGYLEYEIVHWKFLLRCHPLEDLGKWEAEAERRERESVAEDDPVLKLLCEDWSRLLLSRHKRLCEEIKAMQTPPS